MKTTITIECDTIAELHAHLGMIQMQVNQKKDKHRLSDTDELPAMEFHHDNCYGQHLVKVESDFVPIPYNNIQALND